MGMALRTFLIAILLGLMAIFSFHYALYEFEEQNSIAHDNQSEVIYANFSSFLQEATSEADNLQNTTETTGDKLDDTGGEASVIKNVYTVLKLPFNQLKIVSSSTTQVAERFNIPREIYYGSIAIVIILITLIILGIITRTRT